MMFTDAYKQLRATIEAESLYSEYKTDSRTSADFVHESCNEYHLQLLWHEQRFNKRNLRTAEGQSLKIVSPGWWNTEAGPDFRGAQLSFNGKTYTGDVELHWSHQGWRNHGHHQDPRYNNVLLHITLDTEPATTVPQNAQGRSVATLLLGKYLPKTLLNQIKAGSMSDLTAFGAAGCGKCKSFHMRDSARQLTTFIELAGEWRMLHKAHRMRERIAQVGPDQMLFEEVCRACGYHQFKEQFMALARQLPYERCRQLAQQDPYLLEAALFHLANLLPSSTLFLATPPAHWQRLHSLLEKHLPGLKNLSMDWPRNSVRPGNYPERRLSGLCRLLARTSTHGLSGTLYRCWMAHEKPRDQRLAFEALFPGAHGFWATHFTWNGTAAPKPTAPLGTGRVRTIIGNIIVPATLAMARLNNQQHHEAMVYRFFNALPSEPSNQITRIMQERVFPQEVPFRLNFCRQQGLIQMFEDWCHPNPACKDCSLNRFFEKGGADNIAPSS